MPYPGCHYSCYCFHIITINISIVDVAHFVVIVTITFLCFYSFIFADILITSFNIHLIDVVNTLKVKGFKDSGTYYIVVHHNIQRNLFKEKRQMIEEEITEGKYTLMINRGVKVMKVALCIHQSK